jgi:CBS-domain-containing membrane protein
MLGLFAFINGLISIALLSLVAWGTANPFVFPSLGPTAFLLFYQPLAAASSPRNTIAGHLIGILAGYGSLVVFGLTNLAPASSSGGITVAQVGAAALSLAATSGVMVWCRVPHPPAGATTLIVSLGILKRPGELVIVEVAVVLLVAQALGINRLAGLNYPLWAAQGRQETAGVEGDSF